MWISYTMIISAGCSIWSRHKTCFVDQKTDVHIHCKAQGPQEQVQWFKDKRLRYLFLGDVTLIQPVGGPSKLMPQCGQHGPLWYSKRVHICRLLMPHSPSKDERNWSSGCWALSSRFFWWGWSIPIAYIFMNYKNKLMMLHNFTLLVEVRLAGELDDKASWKKPFFWIQTIITQLFRFWNLKNQCKSCESQSSPRWMVSPVLVSFWR